jgi:ABC-type antimicrobial peptide transport system permease subunit
MSTVGLYGVLSYAVAQRTREIGIRIALGASRKSVSLLIFRRLFLLVGGGLLAGVPLTWMSTRILASIAKLTGNTGWLFPASGMLMLLVCGLAGLLPTRRAASVDPTQALRAE